MVFNGQPGRKCGREHERVGADCGLHPLIHTFGSRKDTTTCGGGSERARVWIKVCNVHSALKDERSCFPRLTASTG